MKKILVNNSLLLMFNENANGVKFESPNTYKLFKVLNRLVAFFTHVDQLVIFKFLSEKK